MAFYVILILGAFFMECSSTYETHYVEDYCKSGTATIKYQINSNQSGASAILQGKRIRSDPVSRDCTILLNPPEGYGLSISIRKIDFSRNTPYRTCENYIKIFYSPIYEPVTLCEYSFLKNTPRHLTSERELKIVYHTVGNQDNDTTGRSDFQLTYTTYTRDVKQCDSKNVFLCFNGNCVWKGLICDGVDNCGDKSDESTLVCDSRMVFVLFQMVYIITGSVALFVILAGVIACCWRSGRFRRPIVASPNLTSSVTPYQAIHPSGCFICNDPAGPSDPCPLYHPHNLNGGGGFSNPCYPSGIPQHALSFHITDQTTNKLPNKILLTL